MGRAAPAPPERVEENEAGKKAADMRLPGELLPLFGGSAWAETKQSFNPIHTARKIKNCGSRSVADNGDAGTRYDFPSLCRR
jgi:hypothetical protein